jgi:gas vesicle protein
MVAPIVDQTKEAKKDAVREARKTPGEIADSLRDGRSSVDDAAEALKDAIKDQIAPAKEIAKLEGELTGKALQQALRSKNPEVRAAALAYKKEVEDRLFALRNNVAGIAQKTGMNYADALEYQKRQVRRAAQRALDPVEEEMRKLRGEAASFGTRTGNAWANALEAALNAHLKRIRDTIGDYRGLVEATSPPGPKSPLHGIDVWGERTGEAWGGGLVAGILSAVRDFREALGSFATMTTDMAPFALQAPQQARFAPPNPLGQMTPFRTALAAVSPGGGDTYNIEVPVVTQPEVKTPEEMSRHLRRVASLGYFTARTST